MIKEFSNNKEFNKYIIDTTKYRKIGFGPEGTCYLGNDGLVYKCLNGFMGNDYKINDIITTNDYNLKHFAFPIDIFTDLSHSTIYGYNSKCLFNDYFNNYEAFLEEVDLDKLVSEYYDMLEDIKILSNDNIYLYDLINNLLFNNETLLAIDTLGYYKEDYNTLEENNDNLLRAILMPFHVYYRLDVNFNEIKSIDEIVKTLKKLSNKRNI